MKEHRKIVLVETNIFFSAKIAGELRRLGCSVDIESGYQGVREKAGSGISAVIIDLAARGTDVLETIKKLKSDPKTAAIPLMGFCGHAETELIESARSSGCDLVVTNGAITSDLPSLLDKITARP